MNHYIIPSPAKGVEPKAVEPTIAGRGREGGRVVEAAGWIEIGFEPSLGRESIITEKKNRRKGKERERKDSNINDDNENDDNSNDDDIDDVF